MTAPRTLRVASWNIHGAVGTDGQCVPRRIAEVLRDLDADVIALQEVESRRTGFDMLTWLAAETGLMPVAGPTLVREHGGEYGNGLLTRLTLRSVYRLSLDYPGREPRGALDVILDLPGDGCGRADANHAGSPHLSASRPARETGWKEGKKNHAFTGERHDPAARPGTAGGALRVIATHLGLRPAERRAQVQRLLARVRQGDHPPEHPPLPTVLLGDINEWFLWGRPLRWLHRWFEATPAPATFPSCWPLLALDRIWVRPRTRLLSLYRHPDPRARLASDHLPVVAQISG